MAFGRRKKKQDDAPETSVEQDATGEVASAEVSSAAAQGTVGVPDDAAQDTGGRPDGTAQETAQESDGAAQGAAVPAGHVTSAEYDRADSGPFDASEQDTENGYVDLGAVRIHATEGLQLRLEVEERTKRVIAVTLDLGGSTLQLQAFAAPKTDGLWDEIREQIGASVGSQGGTVEERPGRLGTELLAKLPAQTPDGQAGYRVARFVGIDGPRWFLRGVFGGPAALDEKAAARVEQLFRSVVVVRGDQALPPRELLPLTVPKDAAATPPPAPAPAPTQPEFNPLKRGPEITETR